MAVTYGFFDSINGDRTYNADQISDYFLKLISNGVFATPADAMQVQAASGLTVNVSAGWGFINCKWINNDNNYNIQLDAADATFDRIDRIVMKLDRSSEHRYITLEAKKGTPASTPVPPELTRVGDIYELSLAQVAVAANATTITQAEITDERPDTSVCGFVTGLIDQIDTTGLFAQFTAAFNGWFNEIKDEVRTTTIVLRLHSYYETVDVDETTIPIQISDYNETLDILYVYINGLKLIPGVDYTVDGTNIELTEALDVIGTPVEFEVLKSSDTSEAGSIVPIILQFFNKVDNMEARLNNLAFEDCTQEEYDAMPTHSSNTVYFIVGE